MEINKIDIYNDGIEQYINLKDVEKIIKALNRAVLECSTESKKGSFINLLDLQAKYLSDIGIEMKIININGN